MPLTRRALLTACASTLLLPAVATASAREQVAFVLDDGRGGRSTHRSHALLPLTSAVRVVHLAAYGRAVAEGLVSPGQRVPVHEWERYSSGPHSASLRHLGLRSTNGVVADDPHTAVTLDDLAAVMTRFDDHAAADHLRSLLGEPYLKATAARLGWPDAPTPSFLAERLRLTLGRPVDPARYLTDPQLQLEAIGRSPTAPTPHQPLTHGTAADLHRLLRNLDPAAVRHLEGRHEPGVAAVGEPAVREPAVGVPAVREPAVGVPAVGVAADGVAADGVPAVGVAAVGELVGSMAGVVTVAVRVQWADGRVGTGVALAENWSGDLPALVRSALLDPAALREFHVGLT
ncbi:serine hydrolase [Actinosynnema sp. CA-248983]